MRFLASEPGVAGDFAARLLAQGFTANMGQQGIVENRPGGFMSGQVAKNASPDGYTVLVAGSNL
jgi:tripartite-type tricarboxylate transporter receptor subunit TctC